MTPAELQVRSNVTDLDGEDEERRGGGGGEPVTWRIFSLVVETVDDERARANNQTNCQSYRIRCTDKQERGQVARGGKRVYIYVCGYKGMSLPSICGQFFI